MLIIKLTPTAAVLTQTKAIKNYLSEISCRLLARLSLSTLQRLAATLAAIQWLCKSSARATVENNLALCLPDLPANERLWLSWRSLRENSKTLLELPWIWSRPFDSHKPLIKNIIGDALLKTALEDKRGLLLLLPHLGNWEMVNHYLVEQTPLTAMYKPAKLPAMEKRMQQSRNHAGTKMVATDMSGVKALLKLLRAGGVTVILPDQAPPPPAGEFAAFFGVPAYTAVLAAKLIKQTQCQCLSIVGRRLAQARGFEVVIREVDPRVFADDLNTAVIGINASVENCAREALDQYQWTYKRFKYQPF
jgi:KDO2-lipid IV(A) lauroyltransferase